MRSTAEFEQFFKENYHQFYYYAYQFVDDEEVSRDLVSDGFESAWNAWQQQGISNLRAYVYGYLHHKCVDYLRHEQVKERYINLCEQEGELADEFYNGDFEERMNAIQSVIREMKPRMQLILRECYLHQKKYQEVADELGISSSAVKQQILKALTIIRKKIKNE